MRELICDRGIGFYRKYVSKTTPATIPKDLMDLKDGIMTPKGRRCPANYTMAPRSVCKPSSLLAPDSSLLFAPQPLGNRLNGLTRVGSLFAVRKGMMTNTIIMRPKGRANAALNNNSFCSISFSYPVISSERSEHRNSKTGPGRTGSREFITGK